MGKLAIPSIIATTNGGGGGASAADQVSFDKTGTSLTATNVQDAIEQLDANDGIKVYNAPSYTTDNTYGYIPNVDACTEQGLYKVVFEVTDADITTTFNYLLNVIVAENNGASVVSQTLIMPIGSLSGYISRSGINGTYEAWQGKILDIEFAKCLQNSATGTNSITINTSNSGTTPNNVVVIGATPSSSNVGTGDIIIGNGSHTLNNYNNSIAIGQYSISYPSQSIAIGNHAESGGNNKNICIGAYTSAAGAGGAIAIGNGLPYPNQVRATGANAIQLGQGQNSVANQFQVYSYPMLDGTTGKIPSDRMTKVIELTTTSVELASDNIYNGAELASVTFTLPATVPVNFTAQLNFTSGTTATVLSAPNTINFDGDDCSGGTFTPVASKRYQVLIDSDGVNVNGYVIGR